MKGIAHFASGLCVASFVPGVVNDASQGGLLIALGGACAMLPDTLDFRFERFIERRTAEITPDPISPSAVALAEALAHNMRAVIEDGKSRTIHLHPARRGVIDWVLYSVRFDSNGDVVVHLDNEDTPARVHVGHMRYVYDGSIRVSELGGPSLELNRQTLDNGDVGVHVEFLPWHRRRTHSLILAMGLGLLLWATLGWQAGLVGGLGYAVHVVEDQLGYMGSNLWWPLKKSRSAGLKLLHASDAPANAATVWISLSVLLLNLDLARDFALLPRVPYLLFVVIVPTLVLLAMQARRAWLRHAPALKNEGEMLLEVAESQN
jgi:hypothetical protein